MAAAGKNIRGDGYVNPSVDKNYTIGNGIKSIFIQNLTRSSNDLTVTFTSGVIMKVQPGGTYSQTYQSLSEGAVVMVKANDEANILFTK